MASVLSVEGLTFSYDNEVPVFEDISFAVNKGERVGIIGPNGAGKTTLFHLLCGLLKPGTGNITINGTKGEPGTFNRDVGYIFQNPDDQLFHVSVYDDIVFGPLNLGLSREETCRRAEEVMELTGITHLKNRPPHHLSGGEKRMVAIAAVKAMAPQILIYDEPSSNLDMRSRRRLINAYFNP